MDEGSPEDIKSLAHKEGSELMAEMFNRMTSDQKTDVPKDIALRVGDFMYDNGYRLAFGRWYLQSRPVE